MSDLATPSERKWLDRLEAVRPDMRPIFIISRAGRMIFGKPGRNGSAQGGFVYPTVDMDWVKREVRRLEARKLRERNRDIENHVGAYI